MPGVYEENGTCKRCNQNVPDDRKSLHNGVHGVVFRLKAIYAEPLTKEEEGLIRSVVS